MAYTKDQLKELVEKFQKNSTLNSSTLQIGAVITAIANCGCKEEEKEELYILALTKLQNPAFFFNLRIVNDCGKDPLGNQRLGFYNTYSNVVIQGISMDTETIGTIMHEISHYYFNKAYHNKRKPFPENDPRENIFYNVMKQVLLNLYEYHGLTPLSGFQNLSSWELGKELTKKVVYGQNAMTDTILSIYLGYPETKEAIEFVVRLPELIAKGKLNPAMEKCFKPLADFYDDYIYRDCKIFTAEFDEVTKALNESGIRP